MDNKKNNKSSHKSVINLLGESMHNNPYKIYTNLRDKHPVCQVQPDNIWVISRYNDVRSALLDNETFSSVDTTDIFQPHWLKGRGFHNYPVAFEDPLAQTINKNLLLPFFSPQALDKQKAFIQSTAQSLADNLLKQPEFDFVTQCAHPYVDTIVGELLGIKNQVIHTLWREWIGLVEHPPLTKDPAYLTQLTHVHDKLSSHLMALIKSAKTPKQDNLISTIANAHTQTITCDEARKNLLELLVLASAQLAPHLLTQAFIELLHNRPLRNILTASPEKITHFIDEILRLYSPLHLVARRTLKPFKKHGVCIPAGEPVFLLFASANRDTDVFTDNASTIDLSRKTKKSHLSFSQGSHSCLGRQLAKHLLSVAVETLLPLIDGMSCPKREDLEWKYSLLVYSITALPITTKPKST